jgi:glycosyltransferase involved in cell wall biosynthesis
LRVQGVPVDLVVATSSGPVGKDVPSDVGVVDLGRSRVATALPGLIRYLRRERPVALLSAMHHANLAAITAHGLARSDARLVVSEQQSFTALRKAERGIKERLLRGAMRLLYRRADAISTVSKALRTELVDELGLPSDRVVPAFNPVISADIFASATEDPGHPWLTGDVPVVVAVGRLAPQKDFATLIRAVGLIARQRPLRLIILGEGPLRAELTGLAERLEIGDCIDLPGYEANPVAFMKRASVFVLSSVSEGMPGVLIEALAVGARVVSTDCPTGPREILGEGSPMLVPVGDSEALASAIIAVLDDPAPANDTPALDAFSESSTVTMYRNLLFRGASPASLS